MKSLWRKICSPGIENGAGTCHNRARRGEEPGKKENSSTDSKKPVEEFKPFPVEIPDLTLKNRLREALKELLARMLPVNSWH